MSIHAVSNEGFALPPAVPLRRFSVDEYARMGVAGVFPEDESVELLEGWIVPKMNRNPRHDATIELVQACLLRLLPSGWSLRVRSAIVTDDSQPEPDLAVVRGTARERALQHPRASSTALVVEVADTSLAIDQTVKARIYAKAGIPRYWVVNLIADEVEEYTQPVSSGDSSHYASTSVFRRGEQILLVVDGAELGAIAVGELLP